MYTGDALAPLKAYLVTPKGLRKHVLREQYIRCTDFDLLRQLCHCSFAILWY